MSVSNRKVNSIYSWICNTMTRSVIASAWALPFLIFCSVKLHLLFLLSLNFFSQQLCNKRKLYNVSTHQLYNVSTHRMTAGMWRTLPPLSCITWQIPAMPLATSCITCIKLVHVLFFLQAQFWTLHCVRFCASNFLSVALRALALRKTLCRMCKAGNRA